MAWFACADNNGPVPLELWGFDEKSCKHAVLENARSVGWKGTIDGYLLHMSWIIRPLFLSPTPAIPADFSLYLEPALISNAHAKWEAGTTLAADDPSYDTFCGGWKAAFAMLTTQGEK